MLLQVGDLLRPEGCQTVYNCISVDARCRKQRRRFAFDVNDEQDRRRAHREAFEFRQQATKAIEASKYNEVLEIVDTERNGDQLLPPFVRISAPAVQSHSRAFVFMVDVSDVDRLIGRLWRVRTGSAGNALYVFNSGTTEERAGGVARVLLHEFLTGDPKASHRSGNFLDCRRFNLRSATADRPELWAPAQTFWPHATDNFDRASLQEHASQRKRTARYQGRQANGAGKRQRVSVAALNEASLSLPAASVLELDISQHARDLIAQMSDDWMAQFVTENGAFAYAIAFRIHF